MEAVMQIMREAQKAIEAKTRMWQFRPPGSIQEAQRIIESDMRTATLKAIAETSRLDKYKPWMMMVGRQAATAKLQLSWTIKDFKTVDELMPKALLVDPVSLTMKMARMQMRGDELDAIEKVYRKAVARSRYNDNVLPVACWTWILVKRSTKEQDKAKADELVDRAFKVLVEALKKSDDDTLKRNHEALMNNNVAHFNNSGLGDKWYSLHLEEPKMRTQRQRSVYR